VPPFGNLSRLAADCPYGVLTGAGGAGVQLVEYA
jgi:hypothetical protein